MGEEVKAFPIEYKAIIYNARKKSNESGGRGRGNALTKKPCNSSNNPVV
jgi:hypothetical protein